MAAIPPIQLPLTPEKVSNAIQAIIAKLNNCECPCPGRCPCLDDPTKKLVALDFIRCKPGNAFNLNTLASILLQNGFEVCGNIIVHQGSDTIKYAGCPMDTSDNIAKPNTHLAIGCVDKNWNPASLQLLLDSCCEPGYGQSTGDTGSHISFAEIHDTTACTRTQCCTPSENYFYYCCDGKVRLIYSQSPITDTQKQSYLNACLCNDCDNVTISILCGSSYPFDLKEIQINCLESLEVVYKQVSGTWVRTYYRIIKCGGNLYKIQFDPCSNTLNPVSNCSGTIIRYCCDGTVRTWYAGDNNVLTEAQVTQKIADLKSGCETSDNCTGTFTYPVRCPDRILFLNNNRSFVSKTSVNSNSQFICECNGATSYTQYDCSTSDCPACPTSTQVICHNNVQYTYHKYGGVSFTDTEIVNNKTYYPMTQCNSCNIPFTYKLSGCSQPVTVPTDCKNTFVVDYANQIAKYYCVNTDTYPSVLSCSAPSTRPCLEQIKEHILLPAFEHFYNSFELWNLESYQTVSSLFFEIFVVWLFYCYSNSYNTWILGNSVIKQNPNSWSNNDMTTLINAVKTHNEGVDYTNTLTSIATYVPSIHAIVNNGSITASNIQPITASAFLQSLNSVVANEDILIWLADKWYNAWNIKSTNRFSNDVSNNAETWNSGQWT